MTLQHTFSLPLAVTEATIIVLNIIAWVCVAVAASFLLQAAMTRWAMRRLYDSARYKTCRAITWQLGEEVLAIRLRRFLRWGFAIVGVGGLVQHFESSTSPFQTFGNSLIYSILLLVACALFYRQERPAAVLLLGASQETALHLQAKLSDALWPHRVVSLLDAREGSSWSDVDSFRITFGEWEPIVYRFIRCCIVVVVDLRVVTPAVSSELREIIRQRVQFKTVLIGQSPSPGLDEELGLCSHVGSDDECCALLKCVLTDLGSVPSDAQPISSLCQRE